ncbi:hypothetical protein [Parasynechococcus sp.]|jgi:hypothetical protein|uniref:hypothetical protein n=1 Tax=Parasynechococcus sp. TaxID=3101203 RepID=UPI0037043D21
MDLQQVQALVKKCAMGLFDLACSVSGHPQWDLSLPVGVIDARKHPPKLLVTPVGTINSIVKASSTLGHPLIQRVYERASVVGFNHALTESISGPDSDRFAEIWQEYKEERFQSGQALWSIEDATSFVLESKAAHARRDVALVAILAGEPQDIVTLSVPIAFLTQA